jgi:hypothetical protein
VSKERKKYSGFLEAGVNEAVSMSMYNQWWQFFFTHTIGNKGKKAYVFKKIEQLFTLYSVEHTIFKYLN